MKLALACMCALVLSLAFATDAEASTPDRIMHVAKSYAGTPYDSATWNCADYTSTVYRRAVGVSMPDWDNKQRHYGRPVKHLRRGDLVFFDEVPGDGDPVSHVAVFAGHGMVWHSSSYWNSTVKSEMRWIKGYKFARRIR